MKIIAQQSANFDQATAQQVMETYIGVYANFAYAIAGVGVLVILLNKPFNKLMHGVK